MADVVDEAENLVGVLWEQLLQEESDERCVHWLPEQWWPRGESAEAKMAETASVVYACRRRSHYATLLATSVRPLQHVQGEERRQARECAFRLRGRKRMLHQAVPRTKALPDV